ncbi:Ig-like domain-containing protein [Citrobacter portucalensis]|nr:Ig-like domain-containing protein [Citrobacter portucalensis]WNI88018.1 Ig-like domain-containing protein [Citrobacter portucalensis]
MLPETYHPQAAGQSQQTQPPATPTGGIAADTDTGTAGDNITSLTLPKFSGTGEANTTVMLTINNKVYEIIAGSNGNWNFTLPTQDVLADGIYNYTLQSKNDIGNLSDKLTGSVTIDTTSPEAPTAVLAPGNDSGVDGDNITNITTPKFAGTTEPGALSRSSSITKFIRHRPMLTGYGPSRYLQTILCLT